MRKMHQQQAVEFVKLLEQAHNEIKSSVEKKDISTAQSLLADCQEGAIQLGTLIETTEGEGFKTISIIEEYCELIFRFHERLGQGEDVNANKVYKTLRQALLKVENSIKYDIPIRKEVVFLPYMASMWDSLESVWKAADEDELCDAYVIPIPYYDKNPDGSFGEMHYEGTQYPKNVPITWYENYDFENRRPDMIYIHNPYDELNYVTSVPPFFYSQNLKNFTDELIYIPYFVLPEIDPDDKEAVRRIEHFCTKPAVIYADKVIVQSENIRRIYINVLTNWLGKKTAEELRLKEKILGSGSPKLEKVLRISKEDCTLPEEWERIIKRPDGSHKPIVLYNTSVSALINNDDKMLLKIKDTLRIFKNNPEVALLWRPHPLAQTTLKAMRPKLFQEYESIVNQYKKEAWGIYDDTADMNRAIAISDAYFGDNSSLVQLYQQTGKPIMLQSVGVLEKAEDKNS